MIAFIVQEADEKAEEIDAKVKTLWNCFKNSKFSCCVGRRRVPNRERPVGSTTAAEDNSLL